MQLITLATLLTSVISQDIIIRTTNGPMAIDQYSTECLNFSGTAISSETRASGTLVLYRNRNCGRGRYAWSRGNFDYNPNYEFNSARFIPRRYGDSKSSSQAPGSSNDSDNSNGGGEADGEPSYYHGQGYNYDNYHYNNYNDYNNRYTGRY
ncbi:hypothetical protein CONCODRAFT_168770 [Conidiobolus coronatus NRRL 28638]|uniref:Uncharacterized protein n=1 Tax=Conidiobolus coronatus (strain ATCC 28846 / CBS 209.66 / NRRL 28638) TaxID=796925 RepID=A0A137NTU8_CONC2|nr:hypothetical protein CONCODRAFT_168770 [Conidiobolus coronatus NRRL 28638]|eukprot:KXN66044.1 hypothetical protein CONCODRAFT_168770 [Conidiobolus coronatus NRRL 28638]